jgi:lipopolysaccharide/colanic/teichoic acid biosynthesis glycosyltransferase
MSCREAKPKKEQSLLRVGKEIRKQQLLSLLQLLNVKALDSAFKVGQFHPLRISSVFD